MSIPGLLRSWRVLAVAGTAGALMAGGVAVASAATAANVRFTKVYYNSPGPDNRTNASLNAEYVQITNKTSKKISIAGWTIRDAAGHVYTLQGTLSAGKTLTLHTGKGTYGVPARHRYWGSKNYIWNNTGDTATLKTKSGSTVHTCNWGSTGSVTTCGGATPAPTKTTVKPTTPATTQPTTAATTAVTTTSPTTATPTDSATTEPAA